MMNEIGIHDCPICNRNGRTRRIAFGWDNLIPFWIMECGSCGCKYKIEFSYTLFSKSVIEIKDYKMKQPFSNNNEEHKNAFKIEYEPGVSPLFEDILEDD